MMFIQLFYKASMDADALDFNFVSGKWVRADCSDSNTSHATLVSRRGSDRLDEIQPHR
jgi:hypothetical protein